VKKGTKEAISGMALIASFSGLLMVFYLGSSPYHGLIAVLSFILIITTLLGMIALVTFSRTGWSVAGSKDEWSAAMSLFPSQRLFLGLDPNQETKDAGIMDQKKEDEYYDRRSK
jgi:hypothetical protein